jgi:hypothetical protein
MTMAARSRRGHDSVVVFGPPDAAALREACRVFDRDLDPAEQLRLAGEIVLTRGEELRLAYPNVTDVSFGYRRVRDRRAKRHRVVPTPCVRFHVERKWHPRTRPHRAGHVPGRLLAFWTVGRDRRLCAVPTDVEDSRIHRRVRAQGKEIVAIWKGTPEFGVLACGVRRDVVPDRVYGISCRHVLSLSARFFDETTWGADVHVESATSPTVIGPTRAIAGPLGDEDSFDAQLVEAADRTALRGALGPQPPTRYARDASEIPSRYDILAPAGAIEAAFVDFLPRPRYVVGGHDVGHRALIQSQPRDGTNAGTSGSPVVSKDGRTLLGMHIAGKSGLDPQGHFVAISYMIPAWQLFDPSNYANVSDQETWTLVTP